MAAKMQVLQLDLVDKGILFELEANCRNTYQDLSRKFNLSANAIKKRVSKLIESGVIERFSIELTLAMLDAELVLFDILTDGSENPDVFVDQIGNRQNIRNMYTFVDGTYMAVAEVSGASGLAELGKFLRGLQSVTEVKTHTLIPVSGTAISHDSQIVSRGNKVEFTPLQLRVLASLVKDPRMPIDEIAANANLTARRVRRILQQIQEGGGIYFTVRWNWSAGTSIHVHYRIRWDETKASPEDVTKLLQAKHPVNFWYSFFSATEPLMFSVFTFDVLQEAEPVKYELKSAPFITSVVSKIPFPLRVYPSLGEIKLREMLAQAGY